ncbi:hypothetical protein ACLOJK_040635 [Asimina triloba]
MAAPSMQTTVFVVDVVNVAANLDQMIVAVDRDGMGEDGGSGALAAGSTGRRRTVDSGDERKWVRRPRATAVADAVQQQGPMMDDLDRPIQVLLVMEMKAAMQAETDGEMRLRRKRSGRRDLDVADMMDDLDRLTGCSPSVGFDGDDDVKRRWRRRRAAAASLTVADAGGRWLRAELCRRQ